MTLKKMPGQTLNCKSVKHVVDDLNMVKQAKYDYLQRMGRQAESPKGPLSKE